MKVICSGITKDLTRGKGLSQQITWFVFFYRKFVVLFNEIEKNYINGVYNQIFYSRSCYLMLVNEPSTVFSAQFKIILTYILIHQQLNKIQRKIENKLRLLLW